MYFNRIKNLEKVNYKNKILTDVRKYLVLNLNKKEKQQTGVMQLNLYVKIYRLKAFSEEVKLVRWDTQKVESTPKNLKSNTEK